MEYRRILIDNRLGFYKEYPRKRLDIRIAACTLEYLRDEFKVNKMTNTREYEKKILEYADEIL